MNDARRQNDLITETQSLCPVCLAPVRAAYVRRAGGVFLEKNCPEHGSVRVRAATDAADFAAWTAFESLSVPPKTALTRGADDACPLRCGVCDRHMQTACCVLLELTERCDQHCPWCFARAGASARPDPPLSRVAAWYDRLLELGETRPFNIQLSGGEPAVRDDLPDIVRMGRDKGFDYIQLNTNGRRLAAERDFAERLKDAGLSVVFLQFDGVSDAVHTALRGEPLAAIKARAVDHCRAARLPVTLVPTLTDGVNMGEIGAIIHFMLERFDVVKGVHFQPASFFGRRPGAPDAGTEANPAGRVTMFDVMREVERQTAGLFRYEDFLPVTTGHPLCCFGGSYMRERDGGIRSLMSAQRRREGMDCCCGSDPEAIIRKDRDFVLNKWDLGADDAPCECDATPADEPLDFDAFIAYAKRNSFTLTGMAFQDIHNLDAERLKRCRVQVFSDDGRLIPFCAYNTLYRGAGANGAAARFD